MAQEQQLRGPVDPKQQGEGFFTTLLTSGPLQLLVALAIPLLTFVVLWRSFVFMRDSDASRFAIGIVALGVGVFGVWILFIGTNNLIERLPIRMRDTLRPYLFVGPAMVVLTVYLIYPAINTLARSLMNNTSTDFVGLKNYRYIFSNSENRKQ